MPFSKSFSQPGLSVHPHPSVFYRTHPPMERVQEKPEQWHRFKIQGWAMLLLERAYKSNTWKPSPVGDNTGSAKGNPLLVLNSTSIYRSTKIKLFYHLFFCTTKRWDIWSTICGARAKTHKNRNTLRDRELRSGTSTTSLSSTILLIQRTQ